MSFGVEVVVVTYFSRWKMMAKRFAWLAVERVNRRQRSGVEIAGPTEDKLRM